MRSVASIVLLVAYPAAQAVARPQNNQAMHETPIASVFAFNALIGGASASLRAFLAGRDPAKAFAFGTLGGIVHFSGKVATTRVNSFGVAGNAISSVGTSMVCNAGRGEHLFDEIYFPLGFLRFRVTPHSDSRIHMGLNAYEAYVVGRSLQRKGLRLDWERSAAAGTFVFATLNRRIVSHGKPADGVTTGPVIVMSAFAGDASRTARHEAIHVQQNWFFQEAFDRPIERHLRSTLPWTRIIPSGIEFGVFSPALFVLDEATFGTNSVLRRLKEHEAEAFARQ